MASLVAKLIEDAFGLSYIFMHYFWVLHYHFLSSRVGLLVLDVVTIVILLQLFLDLLMRLFRKIHQLIFLHHRLLLLHFLAGLRQ